MKPKDLKYNPLNLIFDRFRRPIMLIIALMVLVIGYFAVLAYPIGEYQKGLVKLQNLNADMEEAYGDLEKSTNYYANIYKPTPLESKLLDMALPVRPDDSSLIAQITSMAQKSGFVVSNIDIEQTNNIAGSKVSVSNISKVSVRLKIKGGGYDELKQLLKLMESSLMIIDVYSINFTSKSPIYDLALVAYYYNNPNSK
ncbi:MAG: hypothetical protein WCT26_01250 [Candidatus Buchananbacteria bacterium]|jgi:hypothetical protein